MDWHRFALYVLTEMALSLSPGPAVMLVVAYGLTRGWRRSLFASLGILSANALYFAISATGLGALIVASYELFTLVKWVGAAYLAWLGLSALFGKASPITVSTESAGQQSRWRIYVGGLTLQLANPKCLMFFVAILPQFVNPAGDVARQMVWLALGSMIPEFFILAGYGYLAGRASHVATQPRFARWTDRTAGGLMLGAAALVASVRKQ